MTSSAGSPALTALACAIVLGGCAAEPGPPATTSRVEVQVAPLTLPGVAMACYDLTVSTELGTVWAQGDPLHTRGGRSQANRANPGSVDARTICSDAFGNAAGGGITWIGPCDASPAADTGPGSAGVQNYVTIRVDGLYDAAGVDIGDWRDPCPSGCTRAFTCVENGDTLADFDLTIMRAAGQGFFDIAVGFDDIFCSAKLDNCYADNEHIQLLHGADAGRDWTAVFGLACSAGTDAVDTTLLYGLVTVDCGAAGRFTINPTAPAGNARATVGERTLHYGVYRGLEALDCGSGPGSCKKAYWNLAVSMQDLLSFDRTCTLSFSATATDANQGFAAGLPTAPGGVYPYIDVTATLTTGDGDPPPAIGAASCQRHQLDALGSAVRTDYKGDVTGVAPPVMCAQYNGAVSSTGGCDAAPEPTCDRSVIEVGGSSFHVIDVYVELEQPTDSVLNIFDVSIANLGSTPFAHSDSASSWLPQASDPDAPHDTFRTIGALVSDVAPDGGNPSGWSGATPPPAGAGWFAFPGSDAGDRSGLRVLIGRFATLEPPPGEALRIDFKVAYDSDGVLAFREGHFEIDYAPAGACERELTTHAADYGDGIIEGEDLARWLHEYPAGEVSCYMDVDGSDTLDLFDLLTLVGSWNLEVDLCPPEQVCDRATVEANGETYYVIDAYVQLPEANATVLNVFGASVSNAYGSDFAHSDFSGGGWKPEPAFPPISDPLRDSFVTLGPTPSNDGDFTTGWSSAGAVPEGAGWYSIGQGQVDDPLRKHIGRFVATDPGELLTFTFQVAWNEGPGTLPSFLSGHYGIEYATDGACYQELTDSGPPTDDGRIDADNLAWVIGAWGSEGLPCESDLNGDGAVNQSDLDLILLNWGNDRTPPPTGWCEP